MTSAPSRLPASSKLVRVRVEFLEEQIDQRPSAQQIPLGLAGAIQQDIQLRKVEQMLDLGRVQALDRQEVFLPEGHGGSLPDPAARVNDSVRTFVPRATPA